MQKNCRKHQSEDSLHHEYELLNFLNQLLSNPNELQTILYSKILSVTNEHQLSDLITAIDQSDSTIYNTSAEQKMKIMEGQEQIAKGNFFTNEQVDQRIKSMLISYDSQNLNDRAKLFSLLLFAFLQLQIYKNGLMVRWITLIF